MMGESISLPHDAKLRTYPARQYKSKRHQATYCCIHCHETLSGKPLAYSLWLPWSVPIPARDASQLFFDFCSEEHARLWLDDQVAQVRAKNEARALAYRESLRESISEVKACIGCKQEFPVNKWGFLVVPFFDVHGSICEHCGKPLTIEYNEDGSIGYHCQGHVGGFASSGLYGHSPKYCPYCDEKRRDERSVPCCVCQQKKGPALNMYHEYHLWGGGTAIRLYCNNRECEKAFMALPVSQQAFYIRSRSNLAFPPGQVIYKLIDPEMCNIRYIGRTHTPSKRLNKHLNDRSDVPALFGTDKRPYYSRANWMHDLYCRGLYPTMEIVKQVEIAPTVIEWEKRYILHGFQQGWPLVNIESAMDDFVARAKASTLDFLNAPFDALVREDFFREDGIEAFIHAYYR